MENFEGSTWSSEFTAELQEPYLPHHLISCPGLPRANWITKAVIIYNDIGSALAKCVCHCVDPKFIFGGQGPLGDHQVSV